MELNETERELKDNLNKCRCCFRMIINLRGAVEIDENIQTQFFQLTSIDLITSECFSNRICQLCANDLQSFVQLREDLIAKQTQLYSLAGLDIESMQETHLNDDATEVEANEDTNYDVNYESVEDYESEMLEEVIEENEFATEDDTTESNLKILKIEKITSADDVLVNDDLQESSDCYGEENSKIIYGSNVILVNKPDVKDEEDVHCEMCKINVPQSFYDEHIETMHSYDYLSCEKCDQSFYSKIALRRHVYDEHVPRSSNEKKKKKLQYCPLCTKEYDYKKQLNDHIRSFHKKERNTQCDICNRKFYHRDLKKHIEHVHGEKTLTCEVCGRKYSCYDNLKLHMRYHQVPKYICKVEGCGKRFHQKSLLEHHKVKHTDKKQIECKECSSNFFTIRDLKRHVQRVHEKVYRQCAVCEMTFCRKDKYREHILKSHKNLPVNERDSILDEIKKLNWYEKE
ncbi:hypothetical protein PVAND_012554 [Polypedilum vanderplanki]|uniref:Zinc finger protein n=1 Tax=Polypedilum vanderplanki TaxID=319348 RepID=A0A9J6CN27_POLVA|nr:hypothetical protein PVAND_012554 [Polypedilum vanderplanki]